MFSKNSAFKPWNKDDVFYRISYSEIPEMIGDNSQLLQEYKSINERCQLLNFISTLTVKLEDGKLFLVKKSKK